MRRKSTRASTETVSTTTRRTTRRGRKATPSPEPEESAEVEQVVQSESEEDSDNAVETSKRNRKTPTPRKATTEEPRSRRGRARKDTAMVDISEMVEQQPSPEPQSTNVAATPPAVANAPDSDSGEDEVHVEEICPVQPVVKEPTPEPMAEESVPVESSQQLDKESTREQQAVKEQTEEEVTERQHHNRQRSSSESSESSSSSVEKKKESREMTRADKSSSPDPEHVQVDPNVVNNRELHAKEPAAEKAPEVAEQPEPEPMEVDKSMEIQKPASPTKQSPASVEKPEHIRRTSRSPRKDRRDDREHHDSRKDSSATEEQVPKEKVPKEMFDKKPIQRKRKWLSNKSADAKPSVITISTDSLKNIISDVKPVPLADVRLESSSEDNDDMVSIEPEGPRLKEKSRSTELLDKEEPKPQRAERKTNQAELPMVPEAPRNRKVSIVEVDAASIKVQRPPTPSKRDCSNILYITNLVRPFTVLQLKGLLARTGKIIENGFWIDKIKSKCYVKYDTEDEAVETRHALHGVRWPQSNPKCLHVEFGSDVEMEKAIMSTLDELAGRMAADGARGDTKDFGWSKADVKPDFEERAREVNRPVREWDVGKNREEFEEKRRSRDRSDRRADERDGRRGERNGRGERGLNEARQRSSERDFNRDRKRSSRSVSPGRRHKKKENEPPLRLLDDLFRKTTATPCIYWLPLTAEQIAVKEEQRRKNIEEHEKRMEEDRNRRRQEREREREREKEREKSRNERRDRSRERRKSRERKSRSKSRSRDDRRYRR